MKVNIDHLMSEICTPDYPVEVLDSRRQERILNMTKKKIKAQRGKNGRHYGGSGAAALRHGLCSL